MKMKKLIAACLSLALMGGAVMGTLAWLTDRDEVVNTFTVGNVDIKVDEEQVDPDGNPTGNGRVDENEYHLIPGCEYTKDPTMTVKKDSVESYVRMILTVHNASDVQSIIDKYSLGDFSALIGGWDETVWLYQGFTEDTAKDTISFEFRYHDIVPAAQADVMLEPLFTTLKAPGQMTGEELKALYDGGFEMHVVGHAIQTAGFDTEEAAWAAFEEQANS